MSGGHDEGPLRALQRAVVAALPTWRLAPRTQVTLLSVSENAIFLLRDPESGRVLVLRVHRPGYHGADEIRSELAWIMALRDEAGIATPAPVPAVDGQLIRRLPVFAAPRRACATEGDGRPAEPLAVAFEHVPGREPGKGTELASTFRALGAITARLHRHARGWAPPAAFTRKTWDFATALGDRAVWGDWRAGPRLDPAGTALLDRTASCLRVRLARFGTAADRFGLIHADLRLANLLGDGDTLHVIDFDDCGFGWFAYDFAAAVSFFEDDPAVPDLLAAWLRGYRAIAPFAREHEAEIPTFVMLRRMLLLAWIGSHAEAPAARELGGNVRGGHARPGGQVSRALRLSVLAGRRRTGKRRE